MAKKARESFSNQNKPTASPEIEGPVNTDDEGAERL
jgi:hypothetical protein